MFVLLKNHMKNEKCEKLESLACNNTDYENVKD